MVDHTDVDRIFRALASEPRREILRRTAAEPRSVSQLAERFDMSLAAVSKHVQVLAAAELLSVSEDGRIHWCRLRPEPLHVARRALDDLESFWNERLDGLEELLRTSRPTRRSR